MVAEIGEEKAAAILDSAIRKAAIAEGRHFADRVGGKTSMADFIKLYELWTHDGALEIEVLKADDHTFDFNVTRCRYAETYKEMGWADRASPLLQPRWHVLPGLRPEDHARAQADDHGRRSLLHLPLLTKE